MSTPSQAKMSELQTDPDQPASAWGSVEELFGKQNSYFTTDATKAYAWRIDQLDRQSSRCRSSTREKTWNTASFKT